MSEITKPIMLDETGQDIATSLATIATQNRDIYSAATQAAASATAAQGSASNAEDEATAAATSAAAAAQKLDDLETFLGGLDPESAASVAAELGLFEQEVASDYAKKDGYYEQMGVGTADNLAGHGSVNAEYTFGTAGGDSDIGTGAAAIDTVKGNTLVWNQLVTLPQSRTNNGITFTSNSNGSITVTGTASADATSNILVMDIIPGHKYIIKGCPDSGSDSTYMLRFSNGAISEFGVGKIFTSDGTQSGLVVSVRNGYAISGSLTFWPILFDLTKMFGAGYEPSTVAEFEALYPLSYYAYNAGTLINNSASGIKTIGFNQWDEQWELGNISDTTGQDAPYDYRIRSKNYIPVPPGISQLFIRLSALKNMYCYDINKNYLGVASAYVSQSNGKLCTLVANTAFVRFCTTELYGTTYNHDICINLSWSGYRNGEYEPYQENTVYFDSALGASGSLSTIKGKKLVDGIPTGESVKVFPEGLKSAGNVYDEIKGNVAIKRVGSINLGDYDFIYAAERHGFAISKLSGAKPASEVLCSKYINSSTVWGGDKLCGLNENVPIPSFWVQDQSYTDPAVFKQAMANENVKLYYELTTPETYLLDNPLPSNYVVNDFGTEQRLPADTSSSVMAPILYSVQYAMNATDTIRRLSINYISKDSFENFCASLASAIGTYLNPPATIAVTPTYNDNTQEYDYQVTVTPTENNG